MKEILDIIHKTIYQFFDKCPDGEEMPLTDKDKLLLSVNKAICNNLKALEPKTDILDKIRAEIEQEYNRLNSTRADETLELGECLGLKMSLKIIDKYRQEG